MEAGKRVASKAVDARRVASENRQIYLKDLEAGHEDYVDLAVKCDNFYLGDQWDEKVRRALEAEGRPALTINAILAAVNTVLGEHASQRMDITYKPRSNASQESADALTKTVLQIQDNNKFQYKEQSVLGDGLIQDRGWFDVRIDFSENLMGEARIRSEDPIDIVLDPGAKDYDPKTWQRVTKVRWMTLDEIGLLYGKEKVNELKAQVDDTDAGGFPSDSIRYSQKTFGDNDDGWSRAYNGEPGSDEIHRLLVVERQHYKLKQCQVFVDPNTGDTRPVPPHWKARKVKGFAKEHGLGLMDKLDRKVRWTVSCGNILLHDDWSPYKSFTLIPFFPYFRRGRPMGMVRNLLSPQEQLNKLESQQLHVVNTTANSGWVIEAGSLVNMSEDELEERGAETGLVLVYGRGRQAPQKINSNGVPTGLDRLGGKTLTNIREIAGVTAMLGVDSPEVSGVALTKKQSRGLVQMQVVFDNLNKTRELVADKLLELVQDFYTETRVFRVTNWGSPGQPSEEVMINGMSPEGDIVNNVTLGKYDVVVSSAPARDNFEESQFAEAVQLRDIGVQIPDHWVILKSHLADKQQIAEEVRDMQGMGEPTEEEMQALQVQQEVALRTAMAELAELEAKAQKTAAEAQLFLARAAELEATARAELEFKAAELQLEAKRMEADIAKRAADLQNKVELAQLHTNAKKELTMYTDTSKRMSEQAKLMADRQRGRTIEAQVDRQGR